MRHSAQTDVIDLAMANVQATLKVVQKNRSVDVQGERAKWSSRFATFDVLHDACHEALAAERVAIYQGGTFIPGAGERLVTRLAKGGQWIESDFPIKPSRDGSQGFGGGISFAKRWGLMGMVGIVTADDPEEKAGYQDERQKPKRVAVPPGLPQLLEAIEAAETHADLAQRAAAARAANPIGEGAVAVEKKIDAWFLADIQRVRSLDDLTIFKDLCRRVQPRGVALREEIRKLEARLMQGAT